MRLIGPIVCGVQVALGLILALIDCGSCQKGPPLGWIGAGYYAVLGAMLLAGSGAGLTRWMMRWAFAVHLALVMTMIRRQEWCGLCLACAALSLPLLFLSMVGDERPAWKWGIEFLPLVLVAFAAVTALLPPPPAFAPAPSKPEVLVFRSGRCPRCVEFEKHVLPKLPPDLKVTLLDADAFDYIRATPTVVVRTPSGNRVFEGAPPVEAILEALRPD